MSKLFSRFQPSRCLAIFALVASSVVSAQTLTSGITQPINDRIRVSLKGNVHPLAQPRYDQGAVADSFPAERVFLLLQRSAEREAKLRQFLQDAHTPGTPSYHKWLSPEQFAEFYGPDDAEVAAVSGWLQKHGFTIGRLTKGKTAIEFSGNAGQVREAFNTEIHVYLVHGEQHHSNNRDPQIPAALAPVVAGITPLNDFRPTSYMKVLGQALYDPSTHKVTPQWTWSGNPPALALAPGDFVVQYDLNPLYSAGLNGTGVTIGIIGASNIDPTAVANYRSLFGLPPGNFNVVIDSSDPGEGNWATGESYLDVEVAGSIAPGATINLYTAADTSVQSGLLLAAQRAVDDNQAPVLSTSYGECEQDLGSSGNQFWAGLWEQAAAQGQTSFVSSGDGGSAECDDFDLPQPAQYGLAVNGFSSTPWNISVGGTDFFYSSYNGSSSAQLAELANYWNLTPSLDQPTVSLLRPVPEQPWNRAFGLNLYDNGVYNPNANGATIVAGSGGASKLYSKPAWQSGEGVPSDSARDLPDVSLFASDGENDSFWLFCSGFDGCTQPVPGDLLISAVGGTSASTPAMAGIVALINQKFGPQGQANFILYPLAAQHPSAFHDVTVGSNVVPCQQGSANCTLSTVNDNTKGFYTLGYDAGPGYDLATGLGSVDANLLVQYWNSLSFKPTITTLSLSSTSFTHGTPIQVSVAVSGNGGTPSGDIGLVTTASSASNTTMAELKLQGGAASATVDNLPGGQYQITAKYTGDTVFAPSNSDPVTLNVGPENSTVSISGSAWSNMSSSFVRITSGGSYPYGTYFAFDAQPRGVNAPQGVLDGLATGTVTFTDVVGASSLNSGPVNINREGVAEWVPALSIPPGTNSLSVSYSGDASFNASSTTTPFTLTVTKDTPTAFLVSKPSPVALGSVTQLYFEVDGLAPNLLLLPTTFPLSNPASPTGTATFSFGSTALGTVTLIPNNDHFLQSTATLNISSLPLGTDAVTATYSGDGNYNSTTSSFNVVVEQAPTISAIANPSSVNQVEYTAVTATLTGVAGMPVPTGTVSYFAAAPGNDWNDSEPLKNGTATSIPVIGGFFPPGTVSVAVSYSGDSVYGPASVNVSFTVAQGTVPPFALSATPVTITAGATTGNTSTVTVTPQNGFTGNVYFSCALTSSPSGAVLPPTCTIPPSVNIASATPVTAVVTINSTAPSTIATLVLPPRNGQRWIAVNGGMMVAGFCLLGIVPRRRNRHRVAGFLLVLALLGILAGCGGGGGIGGGQQIPGTTSGTYTLTVSGSFSANGVNQVQTPITVTIQ